MKVDFMIIGAQKSATTTLFSILNSHPNLEGCKIKEPHFFCSVKNWRSEIHNYEKLYAKKEGVKYFEASTTYTFYPLRNLKIWDDLYEYNPELKFIYLVRNPVDRIISAYMHVYERGYTNKEIHEAIISDRTFIDVSRYATQINPYIKKFGKERILIIDFDDFNNDTENTLKKISDFLDINFAKFSSYKNVRKNISVGGNKRHYKWDSPNIFFKIIKRSSPWLWRKITENTDRSFIEKPHLKREYKEAILRMLELDISGLESIMGKDLASWRKLD